MEYVIPPDDSSFASIVITDSVMVLGDGDIDDVVGAVDDESSNNDGLLVDSFDVLIWSLEVSVDDDIVWMGFVDMSIWESEDKSPCDIDVLVVDAAVENLLSFFIWSSGISSWLYIAVGRSFSVQAFSVSSNTSSIVSSIFSDGLWVDSSTASDAFLVVSSS